MATTNAPTIDRRQLPDRRKNALDRTSSAVIALDYIAMALLIIGGLNWAMVALFQVDVIAGLFGHQTPLARLIYLLVGIAALWGVYLVSKLASDRHL